MKTLTLIIATLITTLSFSQTGREITTLNSDGSKKVRVVIADQSLSSAFSLYADIRNTDTLYFFQYRDLTYQYITSTETSQYYTKDEIFTILDKMDLARTGEYNYVESYEFRLSRGIGCVDVKTSKGIGMAQPKVLRKKLNLFLGI